VKQGFIPKLDCFLSWDYSQIEYRVLAFYLHQIGYPEMAEDFKAGLDPHKQTAKDLLGIETPSDRDRQFGKTFNFASIYGAGPRKIATMLEGEGITLPEGRTATDLWKEFYELRPGVRKLSWPEPRWQDSEWAPGLIERRLKARGYVTTLWGRRIHPRQPYKALNGLIQGTATGDLVRAAGNDIHSWLAKEGLRSHIVNIVHDEILVDAIQEEVPYLLEQIPGLMDAPYPWQGDDRISNVVPVEVDAMISESSWADKSPISLEVANEHG
jgi:DNA polymerase-1